MSSSQITGSVLETQDECGKTAWVLAYSYNDASGEKVIYPMNLYDFYCLGGGVRYTENIAEAYTWKTRAVAEISLERYRPTHIKAGVDF